MKENRYDDKAFFDKYSQMDRSVRGLQGAGEWHELRKLLPDFSGKRVLDLGCGFGWHCRYALEQGAASVVGIDLSAKMLEEAHKRNGDSRIQYLQMPIEDYGYPENAFDVVLSSLAFHYVEDFPAVCRMVFRTLARGGSFVFSVEHPIFTAYGSQEWYYGADGEKLHWPVDQYFTEGWRKAVFLDEEITKYHKTLTTYLNSLMLAGFRLTGLVEPQPSAELLREIPGMEEELRRPMMLLASAKKPD